MSEEKHERWFEDLDFYGVARVYDYYVEFIVYEVCRGGTTLDKEDDVFLFPSHGSFALNDTVTNFKEAQPYLHGDVKWDGCSNWDIDELNRCMIHGCSREDLLAIGEVMAKCWDWTSEILPAWQDL